MSRVQTRHNVISRWLFTTWCKVSFNMTSILWSQTFDHIIIVKIIIIKIIEIIIKIVASTNASQCHQQVIIINIVQSIFDMSSILWSRTYNHRKDYHHQNHCTYHQNCREHKQVTTSSAGDHQNCTKYLWYEHHFNKILMIIDHKHLNK